MKRLFLSTIIISILFSAHTLAQFEVGASYELRNKEPKSGFGLRVQKGFLEVLPLVDVGLRAHFSYFSDENEANNGSVNYGRELTTYDFGLAGYGGITLGLLHPYVGLGLGSETTDINADFPTGVGPEPEEGQESNLYWNTFVGAKVTIIPLVKPFLEYRYSNKKLGNPDLADVQNGRIIIGISLSF